MKLFIQPVILSYYNKILKDTVMPEIYFIRMACSLLPQTYCSILSVWDLFIKYIRVFRGIWQYTEENKKWKFLRSAVTVSF